MPLKEQGFPQKLKSISRITDIKKGRFEKLKLIEINYEGHFCNICQDGGFDNIKQISYRMKLQGRWNTFDICSTCMVKMLPQLDANIKGRPTNIPKTILEPGEQFTQTEFKWGDKVDWLINLLAARCDVIYSNNNPICHSCDKSCSIVSVIQDDDNSNEIIMCAVCIYRFNKLFTDTCGYNYDSDSDS